MSRIQNSELNIVFLFFLFFCFVFLVFGGPGGGFGGFLLSSRSNGERSIRSHKAGEDFKKRFSGAKILKSTRILKETLRK